MNRNNPSRGVRLFSVLGDTQSDKERNNVYEDVSGSVFNSTLNNLSRNYMAEAASQSILKAQGRTMLVSWKMGQQGKIPGQNVAVRRSLSRHRRDERTTMERAACTEPQTRPEGKHFPLVTTKGAPSSDAPNINHNAHMYTMLGSC